MCKHYQRKCMIYVECCKTFYPCRLCHDEENTHEIDRYRIQKIRCNDCLCIQEKSNECIQCHVSFSDHYCPLCNLWCEVPIYHCDLCNICYKLPPENRFHCQDCNLCVLTENAHSCLGKIASKEEICSICLSNLYYSVKPSMILKCKHAIHKDCFEEMLRNNNFSCPLCKKTGIDMDWSRMDAIIEKFPSPVDKKVSIFCNDCLTTSNIPFHPIGLKCPCNSYNTSMQQVT